MASGGASILVVDDNAANVKLVSFVLNASGYSVRSAINADDALVALSNDIPKLILMDLQLPGKDGLTFTRELKANAATKDIFVVAFTASAMKGDAELAFAAGCDAYMTKPIDTRGLPAQIAEYLREASMKQEDPQ